MVYEITEIAQDARHAGDVTYVLVRFYDSMADKQAGRVRLIEDFLMPHLKETASVPVLDLEGLEIGRQTVSLDVAAQVTDNIERHILTINAKGLRGDRTDTAVRKSAAGISQLPGVLALAGTARDKA